MSSTVVDPKLIKEEADFLFLFLLFFFPFLLLSSSQKIEGGSRGLHSFFGSRGRGWSLPRPNPVLPPPLFRPISIHSIHE